jgi:hypothetical protein
MLHQSRLAFGFLLLMLTLGGCGASSGPPNGLEYGGPTEQTFTRGVTLAGSNIQYLGKTPDGAKVLIADQQAIKKIGDSLDWHGVPVAGVNVSLTQRVVVIEDDRLVTGGTIKIVVDQVAPAEGQYPDKPQFSFKVPVAYNVKRGETIPGTTVGYAGKTNDGAELSGVAGLKFRKFGDSISWRGRLRSGAYLDITVRVVAYQTDALQVTGLATIALAAG